MKLNRMVISKELIRNEKGDVIGTKELVNEVINYTHHLECITREVLKLADGRILVNHEIERTKCEREEQKEKRFDF